VFTSTGPIFLNQGYELLDRDLFPCISTAVIFPAQRADYRDSNFSFSPCRRGACSIVALPGFGLLVLALVWTSYLVAIACVRFRDLTQVVQNGLMIAFFITPILWKPDQIPPDKQYLLFLNPFAALLAVVREPLLVSCRPSMIGLPRPHSRSVGLSSHCRL